MNSHGGILINARVFIIVVILIPLYSIDVGYFFSDEGNEPSNHLLDEEMHESYVTRNEVTSRYVQTNSFFIENRGQISNTEIIYYNNMATIGFHDKGVIFKIPIMDDRNQLNTKPGDPTETYQYKIVSQNFVNTKSVIPDGGNRKAHYVNYFLGDDPSNWRSRLPTFGEVCYRNVWDNIDVVYYFIDGKLKYDIVINPGGNVEDVRFKYTGIQNISLIDDGGIMLDMGLAVVEENGLNIYQSDNLKREIIQGKYELLSNDEYGFSIIDEYDENIPLIIDPFIEHSTFLGGNWSEDVISIEKDAQGNIYMRGRTYSSDFPTTSGSYQTTYGDSGDGFIAKIKPDLSDIIFASYIGGSNYELINGLFVDDSENIYLTGSTESLDFPTTNGAYQQSKNGGVTDNDGFTMKLNKQGTQLLFSTYIGGDDRDACCGISLDGANNILVVGGTRSYDFPVTTGAYNVNPVNLSWWDDGFFIKFNPTATSLLYSTFIGGSMDDSIRRMMIDDKGRILLFGFTESDDFPVTSGAFDTSFNGGADIAVMLINPKGSGSADLEYSTFVGGDDDDICNEVTYDPDGTVYVAGSSKSEDFPTTENAFQPQLVNKKDGIIFGLDINTSKLVFSTFIGGSENDGCADLEIDSLGNIIVVGSSASIDFPTTPTAYDETHNGVVDCVVARFDPTGSILQYSTFIGAGDHDSAISLVLDGKGYALLAGKTLSTQFPVTNGSYDITHNGGWDAFVMRVGLYQHQLMAVNLLKDGAPVNEVYAGYGEYTLQTHMINTIDFNDVTGVTVVLDPGGTNIRLGWDGATGEFSELSDLQDHVTLNPVGNVYNDTWDHFTVNFNLTFNWNYPDEDQHGLQVIAGSETFPDSILNVTDVYGVENDLDFTGALTVLNGDGNAIEEMALVGGGSRLNWTGLTPVYQGTTDIYPFDEEYDVSIWDDLGTSWNASPEPGHSLSYELDLPHRTCSDGVVYRINLSGIPTECDKTNETFAVRIDADNVTFKDPVPAEPAWMTDQYVLAGITMLDTGGGKVDGGNVFMSLSKDNGSTWGERQSVGVKTGETTYAENTVKLEEGTGNLVVWMATDTLGNGPAESPAHRIRVDTGEVYFTEPFPTGEMQYSEGPIDIGITVWDEVSGVNASTIEYGISNDRGETWGEWVPVEGYSHDGDIDVMTAITPQTGDLTIKWRAMDLAGNGPTESEPISVNVVTNDEQILPTVSLISPTDGVKIINTSVELEWVVKNGEFDGILFDLYLDTVSPPVKMESGIHTGTHFTTGELNGDTTYYWTVIPNIPNFKGVCSSGIWSFSIVGSPVVRPIAPMDMSMVIPSSVTLEWEPEGNATDWLYEVFVDVNEPPLEHLVDIKGGMTCTVDELEPGETYYWTVVPINEYGLRGQNNTFIWSFTVGEYGVALETGWEITAKPGETIDVVLEIVNTGTLMDNYIVDTMDQSHNIIITFKTNEIGMMEPGASSDIEFEISIPIDTSPGDITIELIVSSEGANNSGLEVSDMSTITIHITKEETSVLDIEDNTNSNLLLFAVIVIGLLALLLFLWFRRRPVNEEKGEGDEQRDESHPTEPSKGLETTEGDISQPGQIVTARPSAPNIPPASPSTVQAASIPVARPVTAYPGPSATITPMSVANPIEGNVVGGEASDALAGNIQPQSAVERATDGT